MMTMTTVSRSFKAETIAGDLIRDLPASPPNALGLLSCSPETDCRAMIARLQASLPFPVVGGTTWALPFESHDEEVSASLTVIDRPDVNFAVGVSPVLDPADCRRQMTELYRDCEARLDRRPKMLLVFLPVIPGLMPDRYLPHLFEAAGNLPVFGGMVSDDYDTYIDRAAVLAEGRGFSDRMALVALGGDIEPVFAARCSLNAVTDYTAEVDGYTIRRVDDMSFCDYLSRQGFDPSNEELSSGWPLSLDIRGRHAPVEGLDDACDLVRLNPADGSGTLAGLVPLGAGIRVGVLNKGNIIKTADDCLADILARIKDGQARGYRYSLLFCLPCVARYYALVGDDNKEGERIKAACRENLTLVGYYGFNEVCPVHLPYGGRENRVLNYSIVMCAF